MAYIERYTPALKSAWDEFVDRSKNGTFLLRRDYMDYHADRFPDHSLIFRNDNGVIESVLPATLSGNTLSSHSGLTYGGFIMTPRTAAPDPLRWMDMLHEYGHRNGISSLIYKPVPHIYHRLPAEEDLYALFRNNARIEATLISSVIDLDNRVPFNNNATRCEKYAAQSGVKIERETANLPIFWEILTSLLREKYATAPVHSLEEIKTLQQRFPNNIKLYTSTIDNETIAGTLIYFTETTAHVQYIATTDTGRRLKSLPMLFNNIISTRCQGIRYFDFGTSNEDHGMYLNEGLIRQKYGMGGRGIVYNTYRVEL